MKNFLETCADGFDFATYGQAMEALRRLRMKAQDDDLEVVLSFMVRALQILLENTPAGRR